MFDSDGFFLNLGTCHDYHIENITTFVGDTSVAHLLLLKNDTPMIDKFFQQTNDTIWPFLSEVGRSKDIFSSCSFIESDDYILFFYATKTEIVLVAVDIVDENTVEYADEGLYTPWHYDDTLLFFRRMQPDGTFSRDKDSSQTRLSPIAQLFLHAVDMYRFYATSGQFSLVPAIHLVLLTNAHLVNYPKVVDTWQQDMFGVTVLHDLSTLKRGIIYDSSVQGNPLMPINDDATIEGSAYWTKWLQYEEEKGHFDWNNPLYDDTPSPRRRSKA